MLFLVALTALAAWLRVTAIDGRSAEYDEGVYWQSLRAMAGGHALFTDIFSSQPPFFLLSVYPLFAALGCTLEAARAGVVVWSFVGVGAAYFAGRAVAGRRGGLIAAALLAFEPLYVAESRTLQAEAPALAFAMLAVALAAVGGTKAGGVRAAYAFAAGAALAFGCGAKLFDVVAAVPVAFYLLHRPARSPSLTPLGWVRHATANAVPCTVGGLTAVALLVFPFAGRLDAYYDQVVHFHLLAKQLPKEGVLDNLRILAGEWPLLPLAVLATGLAVVATKSGTAALRRRLITPAAWTAVTVLFLLVQHPLMDHHVSLLSPPLALLAAVAAGGLLATQAPQPGVGSKPAADAAPRSPSSVTVAPGGGRLGRAFRRPAVIAAALAVAGGAMVAIAWAQAVDAGRRPTFAQRQVATAIARHTTHDAWVMADDQYLAGLAGRDVPPPLVDTSRVRVQTGNLTRADLEHAAADPRVEAILFHSGHFDRMPGFRAWVQARFQLVQTFDDGRALYVREPASASVRDPRE
jgi:4-amino-4-deoxy-L-arabinose transferase-like glycosyltransferase